MSVPTTRKVALSEKAGAPLTIKEDSVPKPGEGELLIKVLACGVCFSDAAIIGGHMGDVHPRIPGHEIVGDVIATGPGEKNWKVGDRVGSGWHGGHDGKCKQCQKALFQMCDNKAINGVTKDGGFATHCIVRSEAALTISKEVDAAQVAPLLCAGVTLFNSIRKMQIVQGGTVAIQGLGGLGHLGLQYSRKMGYRTVALSSSAAKKDFALKLGAHDYIDGSKENHAEALQKLGGADLIVVTAPNPKLIGELAEGLAPVGKLLVLAPVGPVEVNTLTLVSKGASVHGWPSGHPLDETEAILFAEHNDVNCMIEKFPLEKANDALKHMQDGKVRFRCVLTMD